MGIKVSPDIAQQHITQMLDGLLGPDVVVYIDDKGIWTDGDYDEHIDLVDKVLERLAANEMKCNPLKCDWAVKETDFLRYWMTPECVKPMAKKIEVILKMGRPTTRTEARSFIGAVNFYKSLWPRRAHVLSPLSELTGNKPFEWSDDKKRVFDEMNATIASKC